MKTLLLHLSPGLSEARGWLRAEDGLVDLGQGSPAHFASLHSGLPAVCFLPASRCLFTSVPLSAKQLRQAEQSLAWLIEDQTGEDVEALHVIAGPPAGGQTPLIAIARDDLQAALAGLRESGLVPLAVLPDLFLLPRDDSDWQLAQHGDQVFLRTGLLSGAVLEADVLEPMLDGALAERGVAGPLTLSVAVGSPALGARIEAWAAARDGVSCRLAEGLDMATALAAVPDWSRHPANLLQGRFAARRRLHLAPALRLAAGLFAAAFALQLASEWLHYAYYRHQTGKVAAVAVKRYQALYAQEHLPADPVRAFQEIQRRLRGKQNEGRSAGGALPVLTRVAQSLQGSGLSTQRVDFANGALTLDVDARSLAALDGLKQKLDAQGLSTEILSANSQGGVIRGRLRVEGGA